MSNQFPIEGLEPKKIELSSALDSMGTELISPSEAHKHDLNTDLTAEEERDVDRIDAQGQGNFTLTLAVTGVEEVVRHRPSGVKRHEIPTPREQGKALWYQTGEKQHISEPSPNGEVTEIGIPDSMKGYTPWRKKKV